MRDAETGIDPTATDGEPDQAEADQLALRRARAKAEEEAKAGASDAAAAAAMGGKPGTPIDGQQPIDPEDQPGEEDDGQLFIYDAGRKVTLSQLAARGVTIEHAFVFGGKRMKGAGQLVAWDDDVMIVVRGRSSAVKLVPTRDDQERITKVTIETHVAVKVLANADSEQAMDLLAPVLEKRGMRAAA